MENKNLDMESYEQGKKDALTDSETIIKILRAYKTLFNKDSDFSIGDITLELLKEKLKNYERL